MNHPDARLMRHKHARFRYGITPDPLRHGLAKSKFRRNSGKSENMRYFLARRVCRNVKRWQDAKMALRWTAAGMMEVAKGFRRLKAHRQLPLLRAALLAHQARHTITRNLEQQAKVA